jgi:hypothetical protein
MCQELLRRRQHGLYGFWKGHMFQVPSSICWIWDSEGNIPVFKKSLLDYPEALVKNFQIPKLRAGMMTRNIPE